MNFNKGVLATAIAGVLGVSSAYAANPSYVSEYNFSSSVILQETASEFSATFSVNADLNQDNEYAARFDLSGNGNASFAATLANITLNYTDADSGGVSITTPAPTVSLVNSNSAAVISFTVTGGNVSKEDTFTFTIAAGNAVSVTESGSYSLTYGLYQTEIGASNKTPSDLFPGTEKAVSYFNFSSSGYSLQANTTPAIPDIDVNNGGIKFEGDKSTVSLCRFQFATSGSLLASGSAATAADLFADGGTLVVNGLFTATQDSSGSYSSAEALGRVFLDTTAATACDTGTPVDVLTQDSATFNTGEALPGAGSDTLICMEVNGTTEIPESEYTAVFKPIADNAALTVRDVTIKCGTVEKGGSSAVVPMYLGSPTAAYKSFLRVSNPSDTDGKVFITAYNDKGEKAPTVWEFTLTQGTSSGLIFAEDIIANTGVNVLQDTFALGNGDPANPTVENGNVGAGRLNKVMLVINAEFGNTGDNTGVIARVYSLSKDGAVFDQF